MNPYAILTFIVIIIILLIVFSKQKEVIARWHHHFDTLQFSSNDFYTSVKSAIDKRQIPGVDCGRITYAEMGWLSSQREYFSVRNQVFIFDICAAPYGTGFFVSWWLKEKIGTDFVRRIPFIGSALAQKTYYQLDTETMFKESIHWSVLDAIDEMTTAKGFRMLSELERKIEDNPKFQFDAKTP